jgi:hypothetical protein
VPRDFFFDGADADVIGAFEEALTTLR